MVRGGLMVREERATEGGKRKGRRREIVLGGLMVRKS